MPNRTMIAIDEATGRALAGLAARLDRPLEAIADEAIRLHVERETTVVEAIEEGLADLREGRTLPHDEVVAQVLGRFRKPDPAA